jgi:hypothetical protein
VKLIANLFSFGLSFLISLFVNAQIIPAFTYALPLSVYYYLKGVLRFSAIPYQLVPPLAWCALLFLLGFFSAAYAPRALAYVLTDSAFVLGQFLGTVVILLLPLSRSQRQSMWDDYVERTYSRFQKD